MWDSTQGSWKGLTVSFQICRTVKQVMGGRRQRSETQGYISWRMLLNTSAPAPSTDFCMFSLSTSSTQRYYFNRTLKPEEQYFPLMKDISYSNFKNISICVNAVRQYTNSPLQIHHFTYYFLHSVAGKKHNDTWPGYYLKTYQIVLV